MDDNIVTCIYTDVLVLGLFGICVCVCVAGVCFVAWLRCVVCDVHVVFVFYRCVCGVLMCCVGVCLDLW